MQKQTILSNFLFLIFFCCTIVKADPLLVAVLMIKNEAPVMQATLQPLLDAGIDSYFIYDTGSTDNTIQVIKDFFEKNNITNFMIVQEPFIDFAASRNKAKQLTEQHFPDATFMLMVDAEWYLHNGADLVQFCKEHENSLTPLYYVSIKTQNHVWQTAPLIRCQSNIYYIGKIHERFNITPSPSDKVPDNVYFDITQTDASRKKSQERLKSDCEILLEAIHNNPCDARSAFFLAHSYLWLNDIPNAIKWFEYRTSLSEQDEDTFLSFYRLAELYGNMGNAEKMVFNYFQAFNIRHFRAEPLIRLALYYFERKAYMLSYLLVKHAVTIPYPKNDLSIVESNLYDFVRYDILSRVAWMFEDFALGEWATKQAIKAHPELKYLQEILRQYQTILKVK